MTGTFWMKFRYTLPTWRPSPPSEPEDAPCSGDMTHLTTLAPITYHAITERSKKRSPHSSGYSPAFRRACLSRFRAVHAGFLVGKSGTGTHFSPSMLVSPCYHRTLSVPYSFFCLPNMYSMPIGGRRQNGHSLVRRTHPSLFPLKNKVYVGHPDHLND
jgi:hypothetical protein